MCFFSFLIDARGPVGGPAMGFPFEERKMLCEKGLVLGEDAV